MKANDILAWICKESINGEFLNFVEVPDEYDDYNPQTEEWWINEFGACPPCAIAKGKYMYFYASQVGEDIIDEHGNYIEPDAQIEICNDSGMFGYDYINLYFVEG